MALLDEIITAIKTGIDAGLTESTIISMANSAAQEFLQLPVQDTLFGILPVGITQQGITNWMATNIPLMVADFLNAAASSG